MKKVLKYKAKRKINKQKFKFFVSKNGTTNFLLILITLFYISVNSFKQIFDVTNDKNVILILALVSFIAAILGLVIQIIKFIIDWKKFFSPVNNVNEYGHNINKNYVKNILLDNDSLSDDAKESGYVIKRRTNSDYVYSQKVNNLLFTDQYDLPIKINKKIVTEEEKIVLASILQRYIDSKGNIYDDNLYGQVTDLFINIPKEIVMNKTCYFSNKATNDIVYSKFYSRSKQGYEFNGYKFAIDSKNKLYDLKYSNATNIIGVSTIILTKDNHLLLSIQNSTSDESAGLIVATGSGSAILEDYHQNDTFYQFLTAGMERELVEETSNSLKYEDLSFWFRLFNHKFVKKYQDIEKSLQQRIKQLFNTNSTKVYCYNRILHRGGKPDFFGITRINKTSKEIMNLINDCNKHTKMLLENELNCFIENDDDTKNYILSSYDKMIQKLNKSIIMEESNSVIKNFIDIKNESLKKYPSKIRPLAYENLGIFMIDIETIKRNLTILDDNRICSLQVEYMIKCLLQVIDKI